MPALSRVASEKLEELSRLGRQRSLRTAARAPGGSLARNGKTLISFTCNDYLGLSQHEEVKEAAARAVREYGAGAGASRLVTGNHPLYQELEEKLAAWKGTESALVFGSGYLANLGIIPALMGRDDLILADKLVHACLIDGAKLSGARFLRFRHNDVEDCARLLDAHHAQHRHVLIITDEVFSMDGDLAPLAELQALAQRYDAWLMADGAHALVPAPVKPDIYMGTLSKALGSYGGFAAGSRALTDLLTASARSFIFSTGLPPAAIAAASAALTIAMRDRPLLRRPLDKARRFTRLLGLPEAQSPIVPLILHSGEKTLAAAAALEAAGFAVAAIRPPTVPDGTSRLRFTFSAVHRDEEIDRLAHFVRSQEWL